MKIYVVMFDVDGEPSAAFTKISLAYKYIEDTIKDSDILEFDDFSVHEITLNL